MKLALFLASATAFAADSPIQVAAGAYPDLAVDAAGRVHAVYVREGGVYYRVYAPGGKWTAEEKLPIEAGDASRSDPEVALGPKGEVHVFSGSSYAWRQGGGAWRPTAIDAKRDTALAVDSRGNVYLCRRNGHNGGLVGLLKRAAGADGFTPLPDPDIANGLPKGTGSNHVYGHVFIGPGDEVHLVARHGAPLPIIYRHSRDGGRNWTGSAVSSDRAEAPSGAAAPDGTIYVIAPRGEVLQRQGGPPYTWLPLGQAVTARPRDLPVLSADRDGNLYAGCFGGKWNVRVKGAWLGERTLPAPEGKPLGFVELASNGAATYAIYEQGDAVDHDKPAGSSAIYLVRLHPDGRVGRP